MLQNPGTEIKTGTKKELSLLYKRMQEQFPPCELYDYAVFERLLEKGQYPMNLYVDRKSGELLGYALLFKPEKCRVVCLDYIAICEEHQSKGLGKTLFRALAEKYSDSSDGMLFAVEPVDESDPELARQQRRRISFYENLGARRLQTKFLHPCKDGSFPMHLYFMPAPGCAVLSREAQRSAILQFYRYCCFDLPHSEGLLPLFEDTIADESFTNEPHTHPGF